MESFFSETITILDGHHTSEMVVHWVGGDRPVSISNDLKLPEHILESVTSLNNTVNTPGGK